MYVQNTLGSLLQGVSQQPQRLLLEGQVTEQTNLVSDVTTGLTSRPATEFVGVLDGTTENMKFTNVKISGNTHILGYDVGVLRAWTQDGTVVPVILGSAQNFNYVGSDTRFHVFEDDVFVLNRDAVVTTSGAPPGRPFHVASVAALGSAYHTGFQITVFFQGHSRVHAFVQTGAPDGSTPESINTDHIMERLYDKFVEAGLPPGYTVHRASDVVAIRGPNPMRVTVRDGQAGALLKAMSDDIEGRSDLPRFAFHGTVVRVTGDVEDVDDYYLRYNTVTPVDEGAGFGEQGVWEEWVNPDIQNQFNLNSTPHVLNLETSGELAFNRGDWLPRRVGDEDSNPWPTFVGKKIRDIGAFSGRLVVVAGNSCVMSRVNEPRNFFRKSAVALIDSDPIDIRSSTEGSLVLDWIVPFDKNLLLLSDPGDSQFLIPGGSITPNTAEMVLTTSYEMVGAARPVTTGRTMIFPFDSGDYSGIKEFFTHTQASATNGADTLTQVQDRYIPGSVDLLVSSETFNLLLVATNADDTDDTAKSRSVYVYRYLWDGNDKVQSSWSTWIMRNPPVSAFFENSDLYLVLKQANNVYALETLNLNRLEDEHVGYHVCLDAKQVVTVADSMVNLPYTGASFVRRTGVTYAGIEAVPVSITQHSSTDVDYHFDPDDYLDGATLYAGVKYARSVTPPKAKVVNNKGDVISSVKITVAKYLVHLDESGPVSYTVSSPYRPDHTQTPVRYPLDDEPLDLERNQLNSGVQEITVGERSDYFDFRIHSEDIRPTTILEVEWEGQVTGAKRRL